MSEPVFRRAGAAEPLFSLEGFEVEGSAVLFFPELDIELPNALTLGQTWKEHPGLYLVLAGAPDDTTVFAAAVARLLRARCMAGTRFLWIENSGDPENLWRFSAIAAGPLADGKRRLSRSAQLSLRNVTLVLGAGSEIGLTDLSTGAGHGFTLTRPPAGGVGNAGAFQLVTGDGTSRVDTLGETASLPFFGAEAGCLRVAVEVPLPSEESTSGFDRMDVGCRYFADDTFRPELGFVESFRYPVLDLEKLGAGGGSLGLEACLDASRPLSTARTFFRFPLPPEGNALPVPSHYRSNLGQPVTLAAAISAPAPAGPKLVFAQRPILHTPGEHDPFYLAPEGAFEVRVVEPEVARLAGGPPMPEERLMLGFAGVEYAGLLTEAGYLLHFFPNQRAYAPALRRPGETPPASPGPAPEPLTDRAVTSWSYLTPPGGSQAIYYAQPDGAVLHQAGTSPEFLDYMEVPNSPLPDQIVPPEPGQTATATAFPMVPYTGIRAPSLEAQRQLELQILSPRRREIVYRLTEGTKAPDASASGNTAASPREGATPQGILAGFDSSLATWERLILARTGAKGFELGDVRRDLRGALQSHQLFLVISSREKFLALADVLKSVLEIAGWDFDLTPDKWADHGTLLILKFYDAPLAELAADSSRWAAAEALNDDVAATRRRLERIVADAESRRDTEDFSFFNREVLERSSWNGALFLNAFVPLAGLPDQLRGLAAGIDPADFFAHHVGVNMTPVRVTGGELVQEDSSMFGLISYEDPEHQFFSGTDYRFKVLSLKVLFRNSAVVSFASRIELMINRLFGEPSNLQDSEVGNNLILDGVYQRHGDEESYVFRQEGSNAFAVTSAVVAEVETVQAQFLTVIPPGGIQEEVQTRFLLWGNLRFRALEGLDLFGYGDEAASASGEEASGQLSFANLAIEMRFDQANPSDQRFFFNAGRLSFDQARTQARAQSLPRRFPLQLAGLIQAQEGNTPGGQGFITVNSPLQNTALEFPWFGLVFDVDLGTLGALSGDAGFRVQILAAWAPKADTGSAGAAATALGTASNGPGPPQVSVGLKLPGSESAKAEIPLQGVLKLTFKRIELTAAEAPEGKSYILKLRGIAISVLGISFPPGQTDFLLFGDPEGEEDSSLGWLAAYVRDAGGGGLVKTG